MGSGLGVKGSLFACVCVCAHVHTYKFQPVKPSLLKLAITSRDKLLISLLLGLLGRKQISPLRIFEDQRQTDEALICHVLSSVPFHLFVSSPQLSLSFSLSPFLRFQSVASSSPL